MRDSLYTGWSKHKPNPQHGNLTLPNTGRPGSAWPSLLRQTDWSHAVPQGDSRQPCGARGFCLYWNYFQVPPVLSEGKGFCAGAPDPKQTLHISHSCHLLCVCQRGGNECGCASADETGQVLLTVLAGVISRAPNSGQECEWFDVWNIQNQMRGEVLTWQVLLCNIALGCGINQAAKKETNHNIHYIWLQGLTPQKVWASTASVYISSSCDDQCFWKMPHCFLL